MRIFGLVPAGRLDRMVAARFVAAYTATLVIVSALFVVLDLSANFDEYARSGTAGPQVSALELARYYLLNLPFVYLQVGPFVTLIAGQYTFARLVRANEWLAALEAGVSSRRLLAPLVLLAALVAGLTIAVDEGAAGRLAELRDQSRYRLEERDSTRVVDDLWFRDRAGRIAHAERFHEGEGDGTGAWIHGLSVHARVADAWLRLRSERAVYVNGTDWRLEQASTQVIRSGRNEPASVTERELVCFTPGDLALSWKARENPRELTRSEAATLAARDPDDSRYRTLENGLLAFPLANVALLLVALPFLATGARRGVARGLLQGVAVCLLYVAVDFVTRSLGMAGRIGPLTAAWLALLLAGSAGVALYGGMKT